MKNLILTLYVLFSSAIAQAEPNETTLFFMADSASMFEIGIVRLQQRLSLSDRKNTVSVNYDYGEDKIISTYSISGLTPGDSYDAERVCSVWFQTIRLSAGVNGMALVSVSKWAQLFMHFDDQLDIGFDIRTLQEPEMQRLIDLDSKFWLKFQVRYGRNGTLPQTLTCSGPLRGNDFEIIQ